MSRQARHDAVSWIIGIALGALIVAAVLMIVAVATR